MTQPGKAGEVPEKLMILGQDGRVTEDDPLPEAVAELYASGPDEFVKRRGELADRARVAGQAALAKRIAGLRKPTRSAWIINQLIRSDPAVSTQLADLGEQLRAAQSSLDGVAIRDLSLQRRQLVDALARQAFAVAGQPSPPAAIRDEVTATLGAALADPQVADRVRAGTLERAAHHEGFGSERFGPAGAQVLTLVRSPARGGPALRGATDAPAREAAAAAPDQGGTAASQAPGGTAASQAPGGTAASQAPGGTAASLAPGGSAVSPPPASSAAPRAWPRQAAAALDRRPAKTTQLAEVRARAERDRRQHAIAEAEREAAEADWALEVAEKSEREQERAVQRLQEQLADARHCLADARLEARQAATAQRHALRVLDRLRK